MLTPGLEMKSCKRGRRYELSVPPAQQKRLNAVFAIDFNRDGFLDRDGCPDPDNDGDGIADDLDLEPALPEDLDGFEDEDGAPDLDNDGDGIADLRDMCPGAAEDFDGFEDEDGCPDR